jgi:5-methyltetrahydropteroyltriglutamate--homocysteine methyltransferase
MALRAEQVGSLLRPPDLLAARTAYAEGRIDLSALRAKENDAIRSAIERQKDIGIDVFADGEMRRYSWLTGMADAVDGFLPDSVMLEWHGPGGGREKTTAKIVGGTLHKREKLTAHEVPFLKSLAGSLPGPFKITIPAPSNFVPTGFKPGITERFYRDRDALLADLVAIARDEIEWLIAQGVTYIQLDAPFYSHYLDPEHRRAMKMSGTDPDAEFETAVAGDNATFAGLARHLRQGVTIAVHICRGNSRSRWYTEGGYDAIAEKLFTRLDVDRFLLEYDTDRSGTFEPLRLVPRGKDVVLGLITTKEPALEREADVRRRIDDAARYMPLEHLALSPQCGFASIAAGNLLSMDDQWRKLELVVSVANKMWGNN